MSKKKGKEKESLLNQSDLVKQENQFVGASLKMWFNVVLSIGRT